MVGTGSPSLILSMVAPGNPLHLPGSQNYLFNNETHLLLVHGVVDSDDIEKLKS